VVNFVDSIVVRLALQLVAQENNEGSRSQSVVILANTIFELLRTTLELVPDSDQKFVIAAYL